jgi:putative hemolysin
VGILELIVVILLVLLNGVFVMSELAIVSSRHGRLERLAADGSAGAHAALALAENPSRFLAAVQMGVTLVGILVGAVSGATVADRIEDWVGVYSAIAPYAKPVSILVVVVAVGYLSLIIGELVPKQIALKNPEAIAVRVAPAITVLARAATPVLWLLNLSSNCLLRVMGQSPGFDRGVTDEDIISLVKEAERSGLLHADERQLVEGVLDLADRAVRTIMMPRPDVAWVDLDDPRETVLKKIRGCPYAQVLVCRGSLDAILGIIRKQDLLDQSLDDTPFDVEAALHKPLSIPEGASILRTLDLFRKTPVNTAVIVDEYGTIQGIVTRTDLLEAVAGDLPDVDVEPDRKVTRREDGVPAPSACACCGSTKLAKLGETITEILESVPRQWKVIQTVREKFTCRECEKITQPPAPPELAEGPHDSAGLGRTQPLGHDPVREVWPAPTAQPAVRTLRP